MNKVRYSGPRRRSRVLPVVFLLAALGGLGFFGYKLWARTVTPAARPAPPPGSIAVPVAKVPIPAGALISGAMLDVIYRSPGIAGPEILMNTRDLLGRVVLVDKMPGQAFTKANLAPEGTRPGLAAIIPPGKRALTIDVTKVEGTTGYLSKGDSLDVLAVHAVPTRAAKISRSGKGMEPYESEVIARGAIVLVPPQSRTTSAPPAAGGHAPAGQGPPNRIEEITLAVEPAEAAAIAEAVQNSTIRFLIHSARPVPKGEPKPAADSERPPVRVVEIINGTDIEGQTNR